MKFTKFEEMIRNRHDYAKNWKERTGGKIVGWMCGYAPEEIFYAAGILPVRIMGTREPTFLADTYIAPSKWCSFCRDCLEQGLKGNYDYLDGIFIVGGCFHISQTFDAWEKHVPVSYSHHLYMPLYLQQHLAEESLVSELQEVKKSVEQWLDTEIKDADLRRACNIYNTNRQMMRHLTELRKSDTPPMSGSESMQMVLASMLMDKGENNQLLYEFTKRVENRRHLVKPDYRLMLMGSENDNVEFMKMIETLGANVVIDDACVGARYYWNDADALDDPIQSIAVRLINRPPCPQRDFPEHRNIIHSVKLAKEYNVDAAILIMQKYCDPFQWEIPKVKAMFKEEGIPLLVLEFAITSPQAQLRTRVEALLEMIGHK